MRLFLHISGFAMGLLAWLAGSLLPSSALGQVMCQREALSLALSVLSQVDGGNRSARNLESLHAIALGAPADSVLFLFANADCFAVVAADVRANGVLAYSVDGGVECLEANPALCEWIRAYANELKNASWDDSPSPLSVWSPVEPLVSTTWNQTEPYNALCPQWNGNLCATGCVATAMAQVMNYCRWPQKSKKIPAYTAVAEDGRTEVSYAGFAPTVFDWDAMNCSFSSDFVAAESSVAAVATLMRLCGQAVQMEYGVGASSAQSCAVPSAMRDYFGYDRDIYRARRENFTDVEWEALLYEELGNGRPVIYSASAGRSGMGHCFVIDGADANHYFHVNWGWGGAGDGYYLLSALRPSNKNYVYDNGHDAIVGIQKEDGVDVRTDKRLTLKGLEVSAKGLMSFDVCNRVGIGDSYELALVAIDANGNILSRLALVDVWGNYSIYLDDNFYCPVSYGVAMFTQPSGKLSALGSHLVSVACRVAGTGAFRLCDDWRSNCVEVNISVSGVRTIASYSVVSVGGASALRVPFVGQKSQPEVHDIVGRRVQRMESGRLYVVDRQLYRQ